MDEESALLIWQGRVQMLDPQSETDRQARAVLARALIFAPATPIPQYLLLAALHTGFEPVVPVAEEDSLLDDCALIRCIGLGLLDRIEPDLLLVPATCAQSLVAADLDVTARPAVVQTLVMALHRLTDLQDHTTIAAILPHLCVAADYAEGSAVSWICTNLAHHLAATGAMHQAHAYGLRALRAAEQTLGADHEATATCSHHLAQIAQRLNQGEHP